MRVALAVTVLAAGCGGGFQPLADGGTDGGGGDGGPVVLASLQAAPQDLVVGPSSVYWVDTGTAANSQRDGKVMRVPKAGCGTADCTEVIADNQNAPAGIALSTDGTILFWVENTDFTGGATGRVWQKALPSGMPVLMADMQGGPRKIVADDTAVYWINGDAGEVRRDWIDMGTFGGAAIVSGDNGPVEITVDRTTHALFWTDYGTDGTDGLVRTASVDGTGAVALADQLQSPRGLAVGSTYVYFAEAGRGLVQQVRPDGTGLLPVAANLLTPNDVALDADWLYIVEGGTAPDYTDGRVIARRLDGSETRVLADGRRYPRSIALDATRVYWVDRGAADGNTYDGAVLAVDKPK